MKQLTANAFKRIALVLMFFRSLCRCNNAQDYFTRTGFTPLAADWWQFNDLEHYNLMTKLMLGEHLKFLHS